MASRIIVVCVAACFAQIALSQVIQLSNNGCGCQQQQQQAINLGNLGFTGNNGNCLYNNAANLNINNAQFIPNLPGNCVSLGNLQNGINVNNNCNNAVVQSTSSQIGYGDVAIIGEMPVAGPTNVCGNVPVIGYVVFEGNVPAGGMVSVVDPCGCDCNCNCN